MLSYAGLRCGVRRFGVGLAPKQRTVDLLKWRNASTSASIDLTGIYPPIPTPFNEDHSIAYQKLKDNLAAWEKISFRGYLVQGSNGEYTYLTPDERVEVIRRVREIIAPGKLLLAGSGCESTQATVELTNKMAEAGADAAVVVTPCYYKNSMTPAALERHFETVADSSPVPVILYNVPANTGIDLPAASAARLAHHPNIVGMKESGGDVAKMARIVNDTYGLQFQVLAGSASFLLPAMTIGCVGGICALANVLGVQVCQLFNLYRQGKLGEASQLQGKLVAPNAAVTRDYGVPGLKEAMAWFGLYGGPTRPPLQKITAQEIELLKKAFVSSGFLKS